jgi:D-3-phosphoglycerate dehydrogenase / 2-oxoglutarate reductase
LHGPFRHPQATFAQILMDVLVVESFDAEVLAWLGARHAVSYAPELAQQPLAFRDALAGVRALVVPPSVAFDEAALHRAAQLQVVARLSAGAENIDLQACARCGVEVVRPASASALAEAEFAIGALLQLFRRVPIVCNDGLRVGRELGGATVGLVGWVPACRPLAKLLGAFGATVLGYDPAVHAADAAWQRAGIPPVGLREMLRSCDAVVVLLDFQSRYAGLFSERLLEECQPNMVLVSLSYSALFDARALARALGSGRLAAAWLDSVEPGLLDPGRPLHQIDTLQATPRVAATTRESRSRGAWAVAKRIDTLLQGAGARLRPTPSSGLAGPEVGPRSA